MRNIITTAERLVDLEAKRAKTCYHPQDKIALVNSPWGNQQHIVCNWCGTPLGLTRPEPKRRMRL